MCCNKNHVCASHGGHRPRCHPRNYALAEESSDSTVLAEEASDSTRPCKSSGEECMIGHHMCSNKNHVCASHGGHRPRCHPRNYALAAEASNSTRPCKSSGERCEIGMHWCCNKNHVCSRHGREEPRCHPRNYAM